MIRRQKKMTRCKNYRNFQGNGPLSLDLFSSFNMQEIHSFPFNAKAIVAHAPDSHRDPLPGSNSCFAIPMCILPDAVQVASSSGNDGEPASAGDW
jgi:hypothetical protein